MRNHVTAQYQAWDMLRGDLRPELGGSPAMLDLIGVNYYWNNQWVHGGDRMPPGHPDHRPLHRMLEDLWEGYIAAEVRQARRAGVELLGVCLYPVMDYPGWDDERHCSVGLIEVAGDWTTRRLRGDLAEEIRVQEPAMQSPSAKFASETVLAR